MRFTVVRGYQTPSTTAAGDEVCIYTLDGEKLFVSSKAIEQAFFSHTSAK